MIGAEAALDAARVLAALDDVKDPEIPVVSVVELGIIQEVSVRGSAVTVAITPTFTGCPALEVMREEISQRVRELGATEVDVRVVLSPPWTSDRISRSARERMAAIGIAPPGPAVGPLRFQADPSLMLAESAGPVACPWCGSLATRRESDFGPTICRTVHYCLDCRQSFEQFKSL